MPGHWEARTLYSTLVPEDLDPDSPATSERRGLSGRVWVEDNPVFGRREFFSEEDAQRWRRLGDELRYRNTSAVYGDSWSRREAARLRAEMGAMPMPPSEAWGSGTTVSDWANLYETRLASSTAMDQIRARIDRDVFQQTFTYSGTTTGRRTGARPTIVVDDIQDDSRDAAASLLRYLTPMPDGLKKSIEKVKDSMTAAAPGFDPDDPYLREAAESYHRVYLSINMGDGTLRYWETAGRISPMATTRVLARYYSTQEMVNTLMQEPNLGATTVHPDPAKMPMNRTWNSYPVSDWKRDTKNYRVLYWDGRQWSRRFGPGEEEFTLINPHEDFEE